MKKSTAIELLGGSRTAAAQRVGATPQAVSQWPEVLPERIRARVLAALVEQYLPPELLARVRDEEVRDAA